MERARRTLHRAPQNPDDFNRKLIVPMVLGSVLNPVNSSLLAVALVPIGLALGAGPAATAWLVSGLYLATAVGQPVVGRLVDLFGPRRLYLAGTLLVGIGGLLGAIAPSLTLLVVARVVIGIGTCAGYPAAMYLIRSEADRTGKDSPNGVLTVLAVSAQTVAVIGPSLGGFLIGLGSWRLIFAINIPLAILCLVLGAFRLPRHITEDQDIQRNQLASLDIPGMALFTGMLLTLMLFLMNPRTSDWYLPVIAVAFAVALALRELRTPRPFIDVRVLSGNMPLLLTFARQLLAYTATYSFLYGFTQWLEHGRHYSPSLTGLVLIPLSVVAIATSSITGMRKSVRAKLVVGAVTLSVTFGLLMLVGPTTSLWMLIAIAALNGIPQGLISLANQSALYRQADPARMGSSAGLLRTFTYLGAILASAAIAACYSDGAGTSGLHHLALIMIICALALLGVTLVDRSLRWSKSSASQSEITHS